MDRKAYVPFFLVAMLLLAAMFTNHIGESQLG